MRDPTPGTRDPAALMASKVLRKPFIQEVTECLQDSASRRDLQFLLAKEDAWKVLVAEAELSRDEENRTT